MISAGLPCPRSVCVSCPFLSLPPSVLPFACIACDPPFPSGLGGYCNGGPAQSNPDSQNSSRSETHSEEKGVGRWDEKEESEPALSLSALCCACLPRGCRCIPDAGQCSMQDLGSRIASPIGCLREVLVRHGRGTAWQRLVLLDVCGERAGTGPVARWRLRTDVIEAFLMLSASGCPLARWATEKASRRLPCRGVSPFPPLACPAPSAPASVAAVISYVS